MKQLSYARQLLEHWGIYVEDIPTSDLEQKQEADFLACFGNIRVIIEEKTKEDDPDYLAARFKELQEGGIRMESIPLVRNETISGVIRDAAHQLRSSSNIHNNFCFIWFTATGVNAQAKYEQFIATLYGCTNIVEQNTACYRRCYYFMNSDFYRRATVVDAAVAAYLHEDSISAKLCLGNKWGQIFNLTNGS